MWRRHPPLAAQLIPHPQTGLKDLIVRRMNRPMIGLDAK
mgnify:FL=1